MLQLAVCFSAEPGTAMLHLTYLLQEELDASVKTEDRHGNVSMQWRSITLMEIFGGMDLLCLLPSSPYEQTAAVQAPWTGNCTSVEDFVEQVLK